MKNKKGIINFIRNVGKEKCPKCKEGQTFKKNSGLFSIPNMNKSCGECNYKFEREPGYFIGAMYISYGLALLQAGITYLILLLIAPELSLTWTISLVIFTIILFAKKNYKWSRLLYIYIFPW